MMGRHGKIKLSSIIQLALVTWLSAWAYSFAGTIWRAGAIEEIITRSAFMWRDRNVNRAKILLQHELETTGYDYILPFNPDSPVNSQCRFFTANPDEKHLECWWWDEVKMPLLDNYRDIEYSVHLYLDDNDTLWEWEEDE
jgi:hypothetical protein